MIRIPETFQLVNRTWRVEWVAMKKAKIKGETDFDAAVIKLNTTIRDDVEVARHTFVHELLHATSNAMGWDDVNDDESRIDALAALILQALDSAQGSV